MNCPDGAAELLQSAIIKRSLFSWESNPISRHRRRITGRSRLTTPIDRYLENRHYTYDVRYFSTLSVPALLPTIPVMLGCHTVVMILRKVNLSLCLTKHYAMKAYGGSR
jgi:hypothetical protein